MTLRKCTIVAVSLAAGAVGALFVMPARSAPDVWVEEATLAASDAEILDLFGQSVSISGDRILVGAYQPFNGKTGAAYVFRRDDNGTPFEPGDDFWVEEAQLIATDAAPGDYFGASVSFSQDRALVGSSRDDDACVNDPGCGSGSAYVFRRDDNATPSDPSDDFWVQEAKLIASDAARLDLFGFRVSLSGDLALIGAIRDDDACPSDPDCESGSAYVFRRDDNGTPTDPTDDLWVEEAKLTASDAEAGGFFGQAVSVRGGLAVVGATSMGACMEDPNCDPGAAYVFRRDDNGTPSDPGDDVWIEHAKLTAGDAEAGDRFGTSVSLTGDRIVVSASFDNHACPPDDTDCHSGSAYVFRRDDNATPSNPADDLWVEEAKLTAADAEPHDVFGFSVSFSGNLVVIGSGRDDEACPEDPDCDSGSAYVFRRDDNGTPSDPSDDLWVQQAKLVASDAGSDSLFGTSVAIAGTRAVVGAIGPGQAYVFVTRDVPDIPTVSCWGMVVMALSLLTAATVVLARRRAGSGTRRWTREGGDWVT